MLRAQDLCAERTSEDGPAVVLDSVSLHVAAREVVDVGGPSGVGKSTLLLALARLLTGVTGRLALDGVDAADIQPREWRMRVLYLPQTPALLGGTVREALMLPWRLRVRETRIAPSEEHQREMLADLRLGHVPLEREARRLSVGQAARVGLARCLLAAPDVLPLDEPDAALDDEAAEAADGATRAFADAGGAEVRVRHRGGGQTADRRLLLSGGDLSEADRA